MHTDDFDRSPPGERFTPDPNRMQEAELRIVAVLLLLMLVATPSPADTSQSIRVIEPITLMAGINNVPQIADDGRNALITLSWLARSRYQFDEASRAREPRTAAEFQRSRMNPR
jgi:hypothetical protein